MVVRHPGIAHFQLVVVVALVRGEHMLPLRGRRLVVANKHEGLDSVDDGPAYWRVDLRVMLADDGEMVVDRHNPLEIVSVAPRWNPLGGRIYQTIREEIKHVFLVGLVHTLFAEHALADQKPPFANETAVTWVRDADAEFFRDVDHLLALLRLPQLLIDVERHLLDELQRHAQVVIVVVLRGRVLE